MKFVFFRIRNSKLFRNDEKLITKTRNTTVAMLNRLTVERFARLTYTTQCMPVLN